MNPTPIRRGALDKPPGCGDSIVSFKDCPFCCGRGWFLHNPFATGGSNGAGGVGNMRQCLTCLDVKAFYDAHGTLPNSETIAGAAYV